MVRQKHVRLWPYHKGSCIHLRVGILEVMTSKGGPNVGVRGSRKRRGNTPWDSDRMGRQWAVRQQGVSLQCGHRDWKRGRGMAMVWKLTGSNRQDEGERWGSRRTDWWLLGLFDGGGREPPSLLLLLLEGKDNSGWSVGGGVLPTKAAQAGSQLGRKKNASCSGGCAKGAICSGCGMGCGCVVAVNDGGTDVVGGGQGGGVLNTTAAPPCGFVIGYPRPPAVAALPSSESVG